MTIDYHPSWNHILKPLIETKEIQALFDFVVEERLKTVVFPPEELVFNAFRLTALEDVKVVILGQDPYHKEGQAQGLSFSVPATVPVPPSLRNIYMELSSDIPGFKIPNHGDLSKWAKQGVLLLNAILTVRRHEASSHQNRGWENFTDEIIRKVSDELDQVVFILWGSYAQKKENLINSDKHLVLKSVHPSPLSAYRGFLGCRHFSMANGYLQTQHKEPIDWQV